MHPPKFTILDEDEELCESIKGAFDDGNIFLTNKRLILEYSPDKSESTKIIEANLTIRQKFEDSGDIGAKIIKEYEEKKPEFLDQYENNIMNLFGVTRNLKEGGLENLENALEKVMNHYNPNQFSLDGLELADKLAKVKSREHAEVFSKKLIYEIKRKIASEKEKLLDYDNAIHIYEKLGLHDEAARVRKLVAEQKRVDQTVVHGDQVTKTEIRDSVLNRSNIGGKSSKAEELREAKSLLDEGLINEDDYENMKKDILGK